MIQVEVRLFATLRKYAPGGKGGEPLAVSVPENTTIRDLLVQLGVPLEATKQVFVNHRHQNMDYQLQDGDRVSIFPPVAGG